MRYILDAYRVYMYVHFQRAFAMKMIKLGRNAVAGAARGGGWARKKVKTKKFVRFAFRGALIG